MNKVKLLFIACVTLLFLAGCAKQQQFKTVERICIEPQISQINNHRFHRLTVEKSMKQLMQAAEEVLGEMYFTIEKFDAEQGYIRTRPLAGAQFFEFWRNDNVSSFNFAEANLHSIRRIVELNINRQGERVCIGCDVKVQRLSLPQRPVSSSSRAQEMFSESKSSIQRLKLHPEQKRAMAWVDLGQEPKLATEILKQIEKRVKREE